MAKKMVTKNTNWIEISLIFVGGLFLFTYGLAAQEIIGFESRFYLFALEMWRHGPTWFPLTYQQPYPDYPATSTFLIYAFSKMSNSLNKFSAVFPSALAASITLATTYAIGSLYSKRWGLSGVLFLLFTSLFVMEARTISLDQYVTAITTLSFFLVYSSQVQRHSKKVWWVLPLLVLGFLFRGPLGLVIPAGVVCTLFLLEKNWKRFFLFGTLAAVLLVICSLILLGLAYLAGNNAFMHEVMQKEVLGRMQDLKTPPFYFYFVDSLGSYAITYPLAILILIGMLPSLKNDLIKKLTGWILVIMIGLSIPGDKKVRYILPIAPALALICGYLFIATSEKKYFYFLQRGLVWFCCFFPSLCLGVSFYIYHKHPNLIFYFYPAVTFLFIMQLGAFFLIKQSLRVLMIAALAFVGSYILIVEPINIDINKSREFVRTAEEMRQDQHAKLAFYQEEKDGWVIKYLINMSQEENPLFITNLKELTEFKDPAFFITVKEKFNHIENPHLFQVHLNGKIGRKDIIVFSKKG